MRGFGRRLRELRIAHGLTQRELADRIGVHFLQVSRYERGTTLPAVETVGEMTKVLSVSADMLLFGTPDDTPREEAPIRNVSLLERFQDLQDLPTDDQKTVMKFIDALVAARQTAHVMTRVARRST